MKQPQTLPLAPMDKIKLALILIKDRCCGEHLPYWKDGWATTHSRMQIADAADAALKELENV